MPPEDVLLWTMSRQRDIVVLFKAKNGLVDIPIDTLSSTNASFLQTRRQGAYAIPTSVVDSHLYSFYPSTIRLWNSLPVAAKNSLNADIFKSHLDKITIKSAY